MSNRAAAVTFAAIVTASAAFAPLFTGGCAARASDASGSPSVSSAAATVEATSDNLPVQVVRLYTSGVGYFQHDGQVSGNSAVDLHFKTDQINDVLKSLLVQDTAGAIGSVTYASQDPLERTLSSFEVNLNGSPTVDDLLRQLRGARITAILPAEQITGSILGVEQRTKPAGPNQTVTVSVLDVVTDDGLRSIELPDVRSLKLNDPTLQAELNRALATIAGSRDQDKKTVTVHFTGQGQRSVTVGYVQATPVWKTSYRLMLADKPTDAKIQGWAIVENQTDNDWSNIQLSLVSGRPISFIQDLYQPIYVTRPTVGPQVAAAPAPEVYAAGSPASSPGFALADRLTASNEMSYQTREAERKTDFSASVAPVAQGQSVGDLFEYNVSKVSIPRQSSSMIPIVSGNIQAERVSIYNAAVLPDNPLLGARLKNTTGLHLMGGPLTILDDNAYSGDAQIQDLPPGQSRLLSFGIDQQIHVRISGQNNTNDVTTGRIIKGVLFLTHKYVQSTTYTADNQGDHDKTLIIEQPVQSDYSLVDTATPIEQTDSLYRFQETVPAGKSADLTVKQQSVQDEQIAILDSDFDGLIAISHGGTLPADVVDSLQKAIDLRRAVTTDQHQLDDNRAAQAAITEDQKRIDENLRTIDSKSALNARLMKKLDDQESQLEKLREEESSVVQDMAAQQKNLTDYLANLNVG